MKRLFIAIKISPDQRFMDQFRNLKSALRHERIKWVEEQNIHITLKFFGETEEDRIPAIYESMQKVASGVKAFRFSLKKLGIFGSSYEPRVVWAGIEPYRELVEIMQSLHNELKKAGFEPDRQNLVPHLTLGRIKYLADKPLFQNTMDQFREISSSEMMISSMILFESILKKEGPEYRAVKTIELSMSNE